MDTSSILFDAHSGDSASGAGCREGIVTRKNSGFYSVACGGVTLTCEVSTRLRKQLVYSADNPRAGRRRVRAVTPLTHDDTLVVGDRVCFEPQPGAGGLIVAVLPRRNQLSRRAASPMPGAHGFQQVIAANLDQAVAVLAAAQPQPKWNLLDRYLVAAEAAGLPALICLTKADLCRDSGGELTAEIAGALETYRRIGYPVIVTSAHSGQGIDDLRAALHGKASALIGKSGVGKTTLLNALQPGLGQRTGEVSRATGKGRHTTSGMELFALDGGGALVDTPGTREFGVWDVDASDLAEHFPEMRPCLGRCKFGADCRHDEEPGCAVRKAVLAGKISPQRYHSFLRLAQEEA